MKNNAIKILVNGGFMNNNSNIIDGHVHTKLCNHAVGEMNEYAVCAMNKGLKEIIFLEHFEVGIKYFEVTWLTENDFKAYFDMGQELQKKYQGKLIIGLGVEVGYNPRRISETKDFLAKRQWDRIGLSYHYYEYEGQHINMLSRKPQNIAKFSEIGVGKVISAYFAGLLAGIRQLPITVVCHLDAVLRHHPEVYFNKGHELQILEIMREMAERGIALEVNTAGYVSRHEPYPSLRIIKQAQKMGIKLVAGSDAHRPQDVGRNFDRLVFMDSLR